jgi:hypothetical protein
LALLEKKGIMNKILENYIKEQTLSGQEQQINDIADIVVDEINAAFNKLDDDSPLKTREVALAALEQIKNNLPAMIRGMNIG